MTFLGAETNASIKPQHLAWYSLRLVLQSTETHCMQLKEKAGFVLKNPRAGVQPRLGRPGTRSHNYSYLASSSLTPLTVSLHSTEKLAASIRLANDPTCPALQAKLQSLSGSQPSQFSRAWASDWSSLGEVFTLDQSTVNRRVRSNGRTEVVPMVTVCGGGGAAQEVRRHSSQKRGEGRAAEQ